jgi:putative SOS response-associated peptidase YedK
VSTWNAVRVASYFNAIIDDDLEGLDLGSRFNVAPTALLNTVIADHDTRRIVTCRWGLIPRWAKNPSGASKMINARAENLFERPSYRPLLSEHRCIVPIDGFYEWGSDKRPRYVYNTDSSPLELAGLWTTWRDPDGHALRTCTLLTTEAVGELAQVHHRMPVALDPGDRDSWLIPAPLDPLELARVVEHAGTRARQCWTVHEVSRAVNTVRADGPSLIQSVSPEPTQGQLFDG